MATRSLIIRAAVVPQAGVRALQAIHNTECSNTVTGTL
jgi:hypothetical protein